MPTGAVARLFKRHNGSRAVEVKTQPTDLDLAASREGDKFFLHVANMNYSKNVEASLLVTGRTVTGARVFEIAPENPRQEVSALNPDVFKPKEHQPPRAEVLKWGFPARSVSAVELTCAPEA